MPDPKTNTTIDPKTFQRYGFCTLGHGILTFLSHVGAASAGDIETFFPSIRGSSLLTHLRRYGLIQRGDNDTRGVPYSLTPVGLELLSRNAVYPPSEAWRKLGSRAALLKSAKAQRDTIYPWLLPDALIHLGVVNRRENFGIG